MSPLTRSLSLRAAAVLVGTALCACSSNGVSDANANITNGTMTANVAVYGPWIASRIVSASYANGSLTLIGQDVNYKKITIFVVGVAPTTVGLPREISMTKENADQTGYIEMREEYQVGTYIYNTFNGGHATVTLTTLAPDRVIGTFSFMAERPANSLITPVFQSASGGAFDIKTQ